MAGVENLPRFRFCLVSVQTPLVGEDGIWYSKIYGLLAMLDESSEEVACWMRRLKYLTVIFTETATANHK